MIFPQQEKIYAQIKTVMKVHKETEARIRPHFHMTGPSGSGKSYLLKLACEEVGLTFMELNAAGLTTEGISGNSLTKALRPLREHWDKPNLIFVDEFDKLFQRAGAKTEGHQTGVQDEFLTMLESKYTSIFTDYGKYEQFRINNSLFCFAGAYSNQKIDTIAKLKDAGMRTEFIGRVPLVYMTDIVPIQELRKHIMNVAAFIDFAKYLNLDKRAKEKAAGAIYTLLNQQNKELDIGIRLLNSVIHQHFMGEMT